MTTSLKAEAVKRAAGAKVAGPNSLQCSLFTFLLSVNVCALLVFLRELNLKAKYTKHIEKGPISIDVRPRGPHLPALEGDQYPAALLLASESESGT